LFLIFLSKHKPQRTVTSAFRRYDSGQSKDSSSELLSFSLLEVVHFFLKFTSQVIVLEGRVVFGQEGRDCWSAKRTATERKGIKEWRGCRRRKVKQLLLPFNRAAKRL